MSGSDVARRDQEKGEERPEDERPEGDAAAAKVSAGDARGQPPREPPREPSKDKPSKDKSSKDKTSKDKSAKDESAKDESAKDESAKDESAKGGGDGEGADGKDKDEPRQGRLGRLRFSKKKDMPGGLWLKCESCSEVIFRKELEEKGRVCPACGFHFTLPGRERVAMLLDEGSWKERFAEIEALDRLEFQDAQPYAEKLVRAVERSGQREALLLGTGKIQGRGVVVCVLDFAFMGGSMGEVVGEKVALGCELAVKEGLPLVIFTSSGGARMHEGVLSLMQMAKTCAALEGLNEAGGFSICVMTHPTTGGVTASFASVTDLVLAEPGALIGFAGPRVIATTLKQELPPGFQRAEFLLQRGMIDAIVAREDLPATLAKLIDYASGRAAPVPRAGSSAPPAPPERSEPA